MNKEELALHFLQEYYQIPEHWEDYTTVKKAIQENKQLKEVIEEVKEVIRDSHVEVLKYHDEPSETTSYEIVTVELLQILDKVKGGH